MKGITPPELYKELEALAAAGKMLQYDHIEQKDKVTIMQHANRPNWQNTTGHIRASFYPLEMLFLYEHVEEMCRQCKFLFVFL